MRKVIVPSYKYDKKSNTVVDRYICHKCFDVIKEERREAKGKKLRRYSLVYYSTCLKCKININ